MPQRRFLHITADLLTKFEASIRLLSQSRGVSEIRVARDKLHLLLETLENYRDQVGPEETQDLAGVCKMSFRELSVCMSVLERAFIDSLEGPRLHRVLKELVLKMDNALMEIKKKNIDLITFGSDDIRRDVNAFFDEFVNGRIQLTNRRFRRQQVRRRPDLKRFLAEEAHRNADAANEQEPDNRELRPRDRIAEHANPGSGRRGRFEL